jgi:hypothetical protein
MPLDRISSFAFKYSLNMISCINLLFTDEELPWWKCCNKTIIIIYLFIIIAVQRGRLSEGRMDGDLSQAVLQRGRLYDGR